MFAVLAAGAPLNARVASVVVLTRPAIEAAGPVPPLEEAAAESVDLHVGLTLVLLVIPKGRPVVMPLELLTVVLSESDMPLSPRGLLPLLVEEVLTPELFVFVVADLVVEDDDDDVESTLPTLAAVALGKS